MTKDEDKQSESSTSIRIEDAKGEYRYSFGLTMRLRGGNAYEVK